MERNPEWLEWREEKKKWQEMSLGPDCGVSSKTILKTWNILGVIEIKVMGGSVG